MTEGLVLAMDASTRVAKTALLAISSESPAAPPAAGASPAWRVLATRSDADGQRQARALLRLVDDMLCETGGATADIAAIVAGIGPGTFTGVRIAVATARALALALDIPVVGVSTLSALAAEEAARMEQGAGNERPDLIVPVVDARRGQVFYGVYRAAGAQMYARIEPFAVCDREALGLRVAAMGGMGAGNLRALVVGEVGEAGLSLEPRAERLVAGQERLREPGEAEGSRLGPWLERVLSARRACGRETPEVGELGTPEAVRPIYVRSPDADIHITKMRDPWAAPASDR